MVIDVGYPQRPEHGHRLTEHGRPLARWLLPCHCERSEAISCLTTGTM